MSVFIGDIQFRKWTTNCSHKANIQYLTVFLTYTQDWYHHHRFTIDCNMRDEWRHLNTTFVRHVSHSMKSTEEQEYESEALPFKNLAYESNVKQSSDFQSVIALTKQTMTLSRTHTQGRGRERERASYKKGTNFPAIHDMWAYQWIGLSIYGIQIGCETTRWEIN